MQAQFDQTTFALDSKNPPPPLRVVIAYNDLASGQRAVRVLADLAKSLGEEIQFEPLPWSFGLLSDPDWGKVAASDAINADILIISTSSERPLPTAVGRWTESAIHRKRGTLAAVVALLGTEENPDGAGSSRLAAIRMAARQAGLEFFAPARRDDLDSTIARLHERAELLTPLLAEILHHPHREPRWGINE